MTLFSFLSPAVADTVDAAAQPATTASVLMQFLPLFLIFAVFYLLIIRPQQKKFNEHRQLLDALRKGDKVATSGGIIGTVTKVVPNEEEVTIEIAEGVRVKVVRTSITAVLSKTEVANLNEEK